MKVNHSEIRNYLTNLRFVFFVFTVIGIFLDLLLKKTNLDVFKIIVVLSWLAAGYGYNLGNSFSFIFALILLYFCALVSFVEKMPINSTLWLEKISVWIYIFTMMGTIKIIIEEIRQSNNKYSVINLANKLKTCPARSISKYLLFFLKGELKRTSDFFWDKIKTGLIFGLIKKFYNSKIAEFLSKGQIIFMFFSAIILYKLATEVFFYKRFFQGVYLNQLNYRLTPKILFFCMIAGLVFVLIRSLRKNIYYLFSTFDQRKRLFERIFILLFMFSILTGIKIIVSRERAKFEFYPYILKIYPDIASRYSEVTVYGRNFREMPFRGAVYINKKSQRIKEWNDKTIVIEIDPIQSETGNLRVSNDYGFGKGVESNKVRFTYFDSQSSQKNEENRFWQSIKDIVKRGILFMLGKQEDLNEDVE